MFGKKKALTLVMQVIFLDDGRSPAPPSDMSELNEYVVGYILKLKDKHYKEELVPTQKWNYVFVVTSFPGDALKNFEFRHPDTNKIASQSKFLEFAQGSTETWQEFLNERNTKFKDKELMAYLNRANNDFFPDDNIVIRSVLIPDFVESGTEEYRR